MIWDRNPSPIIKKPGLPSISRWAALLPLALLPYLLLADKHLPNYLVLGPLWLYLLLLLLRWLVFVAVYFVYQIQVDARAESDTLWHEWGERDFGLLASQLVLAEGLNANYILNTAEPDILKDNQLRLPLAQDVSRGQTWLAQSMHSLLADVPNSLKPTLILLTDTEPAQQVQYQQDWQQQCEKIFANSVTTTLLHEPFSYNQLNTWFAKGEETVYLIAIHQYQGQAAYTDALMLLLLVSDGFSENYHLSSPIVCKRPMALSAEQAADLTMLAKFTGIQQSALQCKTLLQTDMQSAKLLAALRGLPPASSPITGIEKSCVAANYCRSLGPFASWLAIALAAEMVKIQSSSVLLLAQEEQHAVLATVAAS